MKTRTGYLKKTLVNSQEWRETEKYKPFIALLASLFKFKGQDLGYKITARLLDIAVSMFALIFFSPLMLTIAVLLKWDSSGPALFRHVRVGLFGKKFVLRKFRTMYSDARARFPELYSYRYSQEELASLPIKILVGRRQNPKEFNGPLENDGELDDPRLTRFGRWLRKTSLDELPNFINVLKGDMQIVGPRPDIEENIRYYPKDHLRKLEVKPGVTGLAQIKGRGKLSFFQTNEYDVEYVNTRSLMRDLRIIYKTITACVKRDGAF